MTDSCFPPLPEKGGWYSCGSLLSSRIACEGRCEVVLTSFETGRDFIQQINQVAWRTVIVDECHRIKEPSSRTTIALKNLGMFSSSLSCYLPFLTGIHCLVRIPHRSSPTPRIFIPLPLCTLLLADIIPHKLIFGHKIHHAPVTSERR